jgi:hypothetical protein
MPDDDCGFPELWDEYQWERFLQEQDQKTEQYFSLFEKYAEYPDRDEIIAREMGWNPGMDEDADEATGEFWAEAADDFDSSVDDESEDDELSDDSDDDSTFSALENSEIYLQSMELNRRVYQIIEKNESLRNHPLGVELATRASICSAKMAAALCGDDFSEMGMTIAYLKRSLKAANDCLSASAQLHEAGLLVASDNLAFTDMLFPIRERLVDLMGEYRAELGRRRGD